MDKYLIYKKRVIKELCFGKTLSALDLSIKIERSLPLTTKILNELVESGFLQESGFASSTGGRRPMIYSLVKEKIYAVAVAMDQLITKIGIIDLQNHDILELRQFELNLFNDENAKETLVKHINAFIKASSISSEKIIGVGIGMPGFVDVEKGINHSFMVSHEGELCLQDYLANVLEIPVYIDNDSSLIALTELKLGVVEGKKNSMVINLGWGIGLGMILKGEMFRGTNGLAGEFSHIPIFENNKLCYCGKSGCLETGASMLVVLQEFKKALQEGRVSAIREIPDDSEVASMNVIAAALAGDQLAVELMSETAYNVGRGIAILIHILNPEQVVISGRGAMAGNMLLAPINQAINKYCIPRLAAYTEIIVSNFGSNAELMGAAALVIENYTKNEFGAAFNKIESTVLN